MNPKPPSSAHLEPTWHHWQPHRHSDICLGIQGWLRDRGSLTTRLVRASGGAFRVQVLRQGWGRPLYSERKILRARYGETALIREVKLLGHNTPWVFARTLIPASSLKGAARRLATLGNKPLGAVLFSDPSMRRGVTQIARLTPRHPLYMAATEGLEQQPNELWGRRTLFYLAGKPLLVNEIFLPDIPLGNEGKR